MRAMIKRGLFGQNRDESKKGGGMMRIRVFDYFFIAFMGFMLSGTDAFSLGRFTPLASSDLQSAETGPSVTAFQVGTGIYDITGPPAEVMFAGMVEFSQLGEGILMRQYARAFIVRDNETGKRAVYVNIDLANVSEAVHDEVIRRLKAAYGDLYTEQNVLIQATHTHSAPGGYFDCYGLNLLMGLGFCRQNFDGIANGIVEAISRAHHTLKDGRIYINDGYASWLPGERFSFNRSPLPYLENPEDERNAYVNPDGSEDNTNRLMTLLKFQQGEDEKGVFSWCAVHGHVSGPFLKLINGDSKGYASYVFEREKGCEYSEGAFVASFAMNDAGDASANLPEDADDYDDADAVTDADGKAVYRADGIHDYDRMKKRGLTQYNLAMNLYEDADEELAGTVSYGKMFVSFPGFEIDPSFIKPHQVRYDHESMDTCVACSPVVGLSMLKTSSEDTKGMLPGAEGTARDIFDTPTIVDYLADPLGNSIQDMLWKLLMPDDLFESDRLCQLEKVGVVPMGRADDYLFTGYKAVPRILPIQIVKIGNFAIIGLPFEVTTMAGRRLRDDVRNVFPDISHVEIAACANSYANYLTTREEYAIQHYEGGANWFGPYSLNAVRQMVHDLSWSIKNDSDLPDYALPMDSIENTIDKQWLLTGDVIWDAVPKGEYFGKVKTDAKAVYYPGNTVSVEFWGAHPNNDLQVQKTYLSVEKLDESGNLEKVVARDRDPETIFRWKRSGLAGSVITVLWTIPEGTVPGAYRIRHYGHYKKGCHYKVKPYEGLSSVFSVVE